MDETERLRSLLAPWCQSKVGLETLWLFGSRAKGNFGPRSDIDLALRMTGNNEDARYNSWFWSTKNWKSEIEHLIPDVPISLNLFNPNRPDAVVTIAVREHGVVLYSTVDAI